MKKLLGAGVGIVLTVGTCLATPPGLAVTEGGMNNFHNNKSVSLESAQHSRMVSSTSLDKSIIGFLDAEGVAQVEQTLREAQLLNEKAISDISQLKVKPGMFIDLPRSQRKDIKNPEQSKALQEEINKNGQKLTMRQKCVATYQTIRDTVTPWVGQLVQGVASLWQSWFGK
jgi:hypothetical protein